MARLLVRAINLENPVGVAWSLINGARFLEGGGLFDSTSSSKKVTHPWLWQGKFPAKSFPFELEKFKTVSR
jgi:hypothetical protein